MHTCEVIQGYGQYLNLKNVCLFTSVTKGVKAERSLAVSAVSEPEMYSHQAANSKMLTNPLPLEMIVCVYWVGGVVPCVGSVEEKGEE